MTTDRLTKIITAAPSIRAVTPAERDEAMATAPSPWRVRPDGCGMVAISHPDVVAALEPDAARRLALALLAAADAAEEK